MKTSTPRIGPKMAQVASLADQPGGIAVIDAAAHVAPNYRNGPILSFGYATVHRAIKAGLVVVGRTQEKGGRRGMLLTTLDH